MTERPLIAITLGDPAGIGPEVAAKALQREELREEARLFLLGSPTSAAAALRLIGSTHELRPVRRPG
ncbi:MAG: 4-hydroxythreonine-4-phosphate dehydrogenase PdxA, partial [Dehalococcoidia bacterium]|nr:4-hydroxythreonine-4-phosphate dehydrogenase PdxA [Dehalococcoidia bacterium]